MFDKKNKKKGMLLLKNHYELILNSGRIIAKPVIASFGRNKNVRIHLTAVGAVIEADSSRIKEAEAVLPFDYIKTSKADSKITDAIISGNVFFSKILRESSRTLFWAKIF